MISKEKLDDITDFLKWNVFRNSDIMFLDTPGIPLKKPLTDKFDGEPIEEVDLVDVIASLHNLLYEAVTGERYDYMFHWANKVGSDCVDNIFDDDTWEGTHKENHISKEEYFASCHDALESIQSVLKNPILKKSASDMLKAIEVTHMITKDCYEVTKEEENKNE